MAIIQYILDDQSTDLAGLSQSFRILYYIPRLETRNRDRISSSFKNSARVTR